MADRKYRQRGYQDDRPTHPPRSVAPQKAELRDPRIPRDPRAPDMPGFSDVFRCARCGHRETTAVGAGSVCGQCGVDLHACLHCVSFDPGASLECREKIATRVSPKDVRNTCQLFAPRVQVERQTGSTPATSSSPRKAFDDLFKF